MEKILAGIICTHVVFLPWAIGGMRPWSQFISLALSVVGFVVALLPRDTPPEQRGESGFRVLPARKLLKFPLFWIGLALLGYVLLQATNPSWAYMTDGQRWWMQQIEHNPWLPTGVRVPFARWGPWRMLLIYSSVFFTVCSIWVGFTRRRTLQVFFLVLAGNGLLLAVLGLAQRPNLLGNGKIFWFYESANPSFFASFVYKNHGGAYLLLPLSILCGLAAWFYLRGLRRMEKSNPSGVVAFAAMCIAVSILSSQARGATLVMFVLLCACVVAFVVHQLTTTSEHRKPIVTVVLLLIFAAFLYIGLTALNSGQSWTHIWDGFTGKDNSLKARGLVTASSLEMLGDHWRKGTGAGSYGFLFTAYAQRNPALIALSEGSYWEHAHNDILEITIELGALGVGLLLLGAGYCALVLLRNRVWKNPLSACSVFGAGLVLIYAWWDFPFQNPAILLTWCTLIVAAMIWAKLEAGKPEMLKVES